MTDGQRRLVIASGSFLLRMWVFLGLIMLVGTIAMMALMWMRPGTDGIALATASRRAFTLIGAAMAAAAYSLGAWAQSRKAPNPGVAFALGLVGWGYGLIMATDFFFDRSN